MTPPRDSRGRFIKRAPILPPGQLLPTGPDKSTAGLYTKADLDRHVAAALDVARLRDRDRRHAAFTWTLTTLVWLAIPALLLGWIVI